MVGVIVRQNQIIQLLLPRALQIVRRRVSGGNEGVAAAAVDQRRFSVRMEHNALSLPHVERNNMQRAVRKRQRAQIDRQHKRCRRQHGRSEVAPLPLFRSIACAEHGVDIEKPVLQIVV